MYCVKKVTADLTWLGGNDRRLSLFENIFPLPEGVSYNSYFLDDEKTVLFDTVDYGVSRVFWENLRHVLKGRDLDYVIINHMEPDHAVLLEELATKYPEATFFCNEKAVKMLRQFFNFDLGERLKTVDEETVLPTGKHELHFVMAPMVHWPEVMVTYDSTAGILFSADAFGTFGALDGKLFADEFDFDHDLADSARRYYANIVGKYGAQVQKLLKKAAGLDIAMICPLHGPVWRQDLPYILTKYDVWSSYAPEKPGVVIAYTSMYGGTENMADIFAAGLNDAGVKDIVVFDTAKTHPSYIIAAIFKYSHLVLAAPTYNGNYHPSMEMLVNDMEHLKVQNRTVALLENGSWAPQAAKGMAKVLAEMKDITVAEPVFSIRSTLKQEQMKDLEALIHTIAASVNKEVNHE